MTDTTERATPIIPEPEWAPPPAPRNRAALPHDLMAFYPRFEGEHPHAWAFPSWLDNPSVPWLVELKRLYAEPASFPASLSPQAGLLLHALVTNVRPPVAIEVGSFLGASTLWMASAMAASGEGVLHVFDDFGPMEAGPWREEHLLADRFEVVEARVERAGLSDRVGFHKGLTPGTIVEAREALREAGGVQLAFLDGNHSVPGAWNDLWAVEPLVPTGGYVILHDMFPDQTAQPGPRHVIDHLERYAQGLYETVEVYLSPLNYGLGVLRRVG